MKSIFAVFPLLASLAFSASLPPFAVKAQGAEPSALSGVPLNHFAGGELSVPVSSLKPSSSFPWRLSTQGRVLASGSFRSDAGGRATLSFSVPPLKPGATLKAELTVGDAGLKAPLLFHSRESLDAVSENSPEIGIWNPSGGDFSALGRLVESLGFKAAPVDSPASFKGRALIACGLDFDSDDSPLEAMLKLCGRGVPVVAIPPLKGAATIKSDAFEKMEMSRSLPDGFEASWSGDLDLLTGSTSSFRMKADDSSILLEAVHGGATELAGFKSCELGKPASARLMLVGWNLAGLSGKSPVPALFLKRFLDMNPNRKEEGR